MTPITPITPVPAATADHCAASKRTWAAWMLCLTALVSAGCASVMRVDSQVKSYSKLGSSAYSETKVSYHFDRLPSQTSGAQAAAHSELEGMVAQALMRSGWQAAAADTRVQWQVQVSARANKLPRAPWEEPAHGPWMRGGLWAGNAGRLNFGGLIALQSPYFQRTLSVVVRDTRTAQVVYESTAAHDGHWNDSPALWQAMVDAALDGFPTPSAAVRQVNIDIPR